MIRVMLLLLGLLLAVLAGAGGVPAGTWALIRDTTDSTTKIYYNNAGALQVIALA
jgi:hypothetical protein